MSSNLFFNRIKILYVLVVISLMSIVGGLLSIIEGNFLQGVASLIIGITAPIAVIYIFPLRDSKC